jgi:basic membrane protein A
MKKITVLFLLLIMFVGSTQALANGPKIAIVSQDAIGDRGFTDMAYSGIKKAAENLNIDYKVLECHSDPSTAQDTLNAAASQFDIIFLVPGYFFDKQLEKVVKKYSDKTYVYIDGKSKLENVKSVIFKQNEGAFLSGALAALLTEETSLDMINKEPKVGFVGGADWPVIRDYQTGFEQGAEYVNSDIEIVSKYAGTHYDPSKGKKTAYITTENGADVIFQAAGPTGIGVLQAAKEYEFYAIGVDTDQGYLQPGYIVSSMLKRVDTAVYNIIENFANNKSLQSTYIFNVENEGIGIAENQYYRDIVPEEIQKRMNEIKEKIINGKIKVKSYLN